jgi:diguanylate cyclase (GGDEF)-like protein
MPDRRRRKALASIGAALLTTGIAYVDFATGVELRVFPLYFVPISLLAWGGVGRAATLAAAVLCTFTWYEANQLAGMKLDRFTTTVNVLAQGSAFSLVGYLMAAFRDALQRERTLSRTDALTGLANSRAFREEAQRVLARSKRHGRPVSLAYIDVDDFKKVNDSLGHQMGDELLRAIARALTQTARGGDLAARLGGDEFAVLLEETDQDGARAFLLRAREHLTATLALGPRVVTTSVGAVTFVQAPSDIEALVQKADALMYAAKSAGKDRFHLELVEAGQPAKKPATLY